MPTIRTRDCYIPSRGIGSSHEGTFSRKQSENRQTPKTRRSQLQKVIEMFADGRSCLDLAQQLHAVEKAIGEAKRTLIHDHVDHCLDAAANGSAKSAKSVVGEFKAISKYL